MPPRSPERLRWPLAEDDAGGALFPDERQLTRHIGAGAYRGLEFLHVNARTIINPVAHERFGFRYTINPYRGCSHACVYCFARPTHAYLGLGIGTDFERKIVVKVNAVEQLRAELASPRWQHDLIALGTNTDPYQHAEGKYHLTQGIVRVLSEARNPFSILTKSTLVLRDLDLLVEATARSSVRLNISIGTLDRDVWRSTEPGTPPPERRIEAVRRLNDAGVPCGVLIAPVLPGLSDRHDQINSLIDAAFEAGAVSVGGSALHLRSGVREHYLAWLAQHHQSLLAHYERLFCDRAYQPKPDQARLARLFARGARPFDPPRRPSRRLETGGDPDEALSCPSGGIPVQLRLLS